MFAHMFDHCRWDNSVFVLGMFWCTLLLLTYLGTLYYRWQEGKEEEESQQKKEAQMAAE